ncbi:MAG: glutathione peroxidase [Cyanobacteria bacterium SZAS LIN-2]|nr:glutathione peroxidase [Cyanobacteria bacterium SZAS LIN-3]MBS1998946.1 glutathione peroxidase [Cyanobacteria bacterium SZAS LIN-2]MBS2009720.1 glutathione peroxidase [Cyanobacteria bacterium SZAS TMP-1]
MSDIYEFTAKSLGGEPISLDKYRGQVMLVVNTASHCGFTNQYAGLQALHQKFAPKLAVLGFPCNQFGQQEPGDSSEIGAFCQKNYGVEFQMFDKVEVNGAGADPIFKYLTEAAPGALGSKAVKWNFTKFLIDKDGKVLKRFAPNVAPEALEKEIAELVK